MGAWPCPFIRDLLDGLRPTTAVGLSDDLITAREISKQFSCSEAGAEGPEGSEARAVLQGGRGRLAQGSRRGTDFAVGATELAGISVFSLIR